jgi:hypothetical protein
MCLVFGAPAMSRFTLIVFFFGLNIVLQIGLFCLVVPFLVRDQPPCPVAVNILFLFNFVTEGIGIHVQTWECLIEDTARSVLYVRLPARMVSGTEHTDLALNQCCGSGSTGSTCFWASRIRILLSEVWIRIRILLSSCKNSKTNLDSYYFVTLFKFLSMKNEVNVPSKSKKQKKLC